MSENFTRSEGLVKEISITGWFAGPEGQQGFEVVVLKKTKRGSRYIRTLKPGEKLDFGERFGSDHIALAVDLRAGRYFTIQRNFDVYERGRSIKVQAKVRYRVTDVANVAMNHVDPLGELRDKVIAALTCELKKHREASITPKTIEGIIRGVEYIPDLGLMIVGADIIDFKGDESVTRAITNRDDLDYEISIKQKKLQAELDAEKYRADVHRQIKDDDYQLKLKHIQQRLNTIDLTNPNHLMQLHSNVIPQILASFDEREKKLLETKIGLVNQAVDAYISDQKAIKGEVNYNKIREIMQGLLPTQSQSQLKGLTSGDIIYDDNPGNTGMDDDIIYDD
ncbi:MAG: hypothetical protein D6813_12155 [Calditrichaeota bacterium]|nr:MAG: hypothetical protein D6813_12155 [Calditrichota bacterium]